MSNIFSSKKSGAFANRKMNKYHCSMWKEKFLRKNEKDLFFESLLLFACNVELNFWDMTAQFIHVDSSYGDGGGEKICRIQFVLRAALQPVRHEFISLSKQIQFMNFIFSTFLLHSKLFSERASWKLSDMPNNAGGEIKVFLLLILRTRNNVSKFSIPT